MKYFDKQIMRTDLLDFSEVFRAEGVFAKELASILLIEYNESLP